MSYCIDTRLAEQDKEMQGVIKENWKLQKENELLMKIARVASWTTNGSRIYKDPIKVTVSQEFYFLLSKAYHEYEKYEREQVDDVLLAVDQ